MYETEDSQIVQFSFMSSITTGLLLFIFSEHVDDVRAIVQRAVKDLAIEMSLKTYEEVWLSKIFELRPHTRNKTPSAELAAAENQSEYSQVDHFCL